ncbi:MAG: tetratricopeptide repeat protein, partial [Chloroflexota bacterium]|nr:tetratricopeptide repeat protein [Chloroflexota bacterium]
GLYDYLAQQVFDQQPPPIQDFLLRTALLEEFDAALCEAVFAQEWRLPSESWQALLDTLAQRNLFVLPVGEDGNALRYHHLFQEFLQKKLLEERPDEETKILQRLATVYTERQEWEKAHALYRRLDDLEAVATLIEQAGLALLNAGRTQLLATWLIDLPATFLNRHPALLSLKGEVFSRQGEVQQALILFDQAEGMLRSGTDALSLAYTLMRRAVVHRLLGNYQASIDDADLVLDFPWQNADTDQEFSVIKALALRAKGISLHASGQPSHGIDFLYQALPIFQALDDPQNSAAVSTNIAVIYMAQGHHAQALPLLQDALSTWRRLANGSAQAVVLNNLGVLFHLQGDYAQALTFLEEAHLCAERSGYTRFVGLTLTGLGDLFVDLEMWTIAQRFYRHALVVAQKINEHFLLLYLELALVKIASLTGDQEQAFERLDAVGKLMLDHKSTYEWGLYQLVRGRYYLAQGKAADAIAPLLDAQVRFSESDQPLEQASTHFLLAAAWQSVSKPQQMRDQWDMGIQIAFTLESRHPLITTLRTVKDFLRSVQAQVADDKRVKRLVTEVDAFEQALPSLSRQLRQALSPAMSALLVDLPPKLSIRALGHAEVLVDGRAIGHSEWQTQVARDLLFCLLAHPTGLTKEEVGLLFWPDASPPELKTRFKNALYRLRSALNQDTILFENEIYRFNHALDYEYDLENFLQKVTEGNRATDPALQMAAYSAAVQLYGGA